MGFASSASVGYSFGALGVEIEWLRRANRAGSGGLTVGDASGPAIIGKDTEWSDITPPFGEMLDFQGQDLLVNVTYSLGPLGAGGKFRPYAGAGAGISTVQFQWYQAFIRKSIAGGYLESFGGSMSNPDAVPEWQRAAAGTISDLTHAVEEAGFAFQFLAGLEMDLGSGVALDLRGRLNTGRNFENPGVGWDQIRSHVPVHADGTTPFESDLAFSDLGYWGVGLSLKYRGAGG